MAAETAEEEYGRARLATIFNSFAQRAADDFPELKTNFAIFDLQHRVAHAPLNDAGRRGAADESLDEVYRRLTAGADGGEGGGVNASAFKKAEFGRVGEEKFDFSAIIYGGVDTRVRTMSPATDEYNREISYVMEHELGHIVAPGGYAKRTLGTNVSENVADTFSFLRRLQQGDDVSTAMETAAWVRASHYMGAGEKDHLTTLSVQALGGLAQRHDLTQLTPDETSNLAFRIALDNAPSPGLMEALQHSLAVAKDYGSGTGVQARLEGCAEIMLNNNGPFAKEIFGIAKAYLKPIMDGNFDILGSQIDRTSLEGCLLKVEGPYWDDVRKGMEARDAAFAAPAGDPHQAKTFDGYSAAIHGQVNDMKLMGRFDAHPGERIPPDHETTYSAYMNAAAASYTALSFIADKHQPLVLPDSGYASLERSFAREGNVTTDALAEALTLGRIDALSKRMDLTKTGPDHAASIATALALPVLGAESLKAADTALISKALSSKDPADLKALAGSLLSGDPAEKMTLGDQACFKAAKMVLDRQAPDDAEWRGLRQKLDMRDAAIDDAFLKSSDGQNLLATSTLKGAAPAAGQPPHLPEARA